MKITKLSLTNFRSFKDKQTINFAPVTLLFGPNSVGKSTVLMALFYLQQILDRGECDPQNIEALGNKFVGGFESLVNGRELSKSIKIKVEYEMNGTFGSNYYDYTPKLDFSDQLAVDTSIIAKSKRAIEFEISWSKVTKTAYVSKICYWIKNQFIGELLSDEGQTRTCISRLNYLHHALIPNNHDEWLVNQFESGGPIHGQNFDQALLEARDIEVPTDREISKGADNPLDDYDELLPNIDISSYVSYLHELVLDQSTDKKGLEDVEDTSILNTPLYFNSCLGALPTLNKSLKLFLDFDDDHSNRVFEEIISEVFVTPLDDLLTLLNDSLCIGPLRIVPDGNFQQTPFPKMADWYTGKAAWDTLAKVEIGVLNKVDSWIASESKLNLGIGLSVNTTKIHTESNIISNLLSTNSIKSSEKISYSLFDLSNNISVTPAEVGVGISQIMPLVVSAITSKKGFVSCEQPELHVHPRVQVAIGDLLTQANKKANFIIETHSEHLILRILRRIRETNDSELPDGFLPVASKDISIVYLDPTEHGVNVKNIRVNEEGDFVDKWPKGFFAERRGELY